MTFPEDTQNFTVVGAMFLDNFDLNQFPNGLPVAQVDKGGGAYPSNAWMALHNTGLGCCGGVYKMSDMKIDGGATVDVLADAAQVDLQRLSLGPSNYIGIETGFNSTFNSTISDIPNYGANGLAGIMALGGFTHVRNVDGCCSLAQVILLGDMSGKNFFMTNGHNECGVLELGEGSLSGLRFDSENRGKFWGVCFEAGNGKVDVSGSSIYPSGNFAAFKAFGDAGSFWNGLTVKDSNIWSGPAVLELSDLIGDKYPLSPIKFEGNTYNGLTDPSAAGVALTDIGVPATLVGAKTQFPEMQAQVDPAILSYSDPTRACIANSCALAAPPGVQPGDMELAFLHIGASGGADPGGTSAPGATWHLGCTADNHAHNVKAQVYWHLASANDAPPFTFSVANTSASIEGQIFRLTGVSQLGPDLCVPTTATGSSVTLGGGTSHDKNDLVLVNTVDWCCTRAVPSDPPTGTVFRNPVNNAGANPGLWSYLTGSTTVPKFTVNGTNGGWAGIQVALYPGRSQATTMPVDAGAPVLYSGEPFALIENLGLKCKTVATLPTTLPSGSLTCVTDWDGKAGICAGGGSNYGLALYNGAAWQCAY